MSMSELQRIGRILGVKADVDDKTMCLLIQDKIKEKDSEIKKKKFCNNILVAQKKQLQSEIKNLHNEYAECIGIHEYMMVKQSRDTIRKELNKVLEENHKRNETMRKFNDRDFKDKLKKIEGVK